MKSMETRINKLIGFLIGKSPVKKPNIDFFNSKLSLLHIKFGEFDIYLWGIGEIDKCKVGDAYSFSFPLTNALTDRNILIYFRDNSIVIENDWLGSIPVFYNPKKIIVSTIPNFCIDEKIVHYEGLANFCDFGYSVFEQTFFQEVKFLRYYSRMLVSKDGISIKYKDDIQLELKESTVDEVINKIKEYIDERAINKETYEIIPTSGGYDSRLLNYLHPKKDKILSFTYGISKNQYDSFEVVFAKELSKILKTKWNWIKLENFYEIEYIKKWFQIYGISTHLHGMYHIEFYNKIRSLLEKEFENASFTLLSGIFGDVWAGSIKYEDVNTYAELSKLGYTHGLRLDMKYLKQKPILSELREQFWNNNLQLIKNDIYKPILTVRLKIILISYLTIIPEYFGWPVWTPFLNFDIVSAMLRLPSELRRKRQWQKLFFRERGLNVEDFAGKITYNNQLDVEVARNSNIEPLDAKILKTYFSHHRISQINTIINTISRKSSSLTGILNNFYSNLFYIRKVGGLLRRVGLSDPFVKALNEYYVLKAIELGFKHEKN